MTITTKELFRSIWKSCDELRYTIEPIYYKDYILRLLFLKYMSDKEQSGYFNRLEQALDTNAIGQAINQTFVQFEVDHQINAILSCVDFDDEKKLGKQKSLIASGLVRVFMKLDFRGAKGDLVTDAYEFLAHNFAVEAAKNKGQFYTPSHVASLLSQLLGIANHHGATVYDPTCGSAALLAQAVKLNPSVKAFGQELDMNATMLAQMNLMLYGANGLDIRQGNTLADPAFADGVFDYVVANPPFSVDNWSYGVDWQTDNRFKDYPLPPNKNGDYAFILHGLASLNATGKAAMILPTGVLFRGGREAQIRKQLLESGMLHTVIGLSDSIFYGTTIPTVILLFDTPKRYDDVLFIDASNDYIERDKLKVLQERHIHKLLNVVNNRITVQRYSNLVAIDTILTDDANLNITRYVDTIKPERELDLYALNKGGIPNNDIELLSEYWQQFPNLKADLFKDSHTHTRKRYNVDTEFFYSQFNVSQDNLPSFIKQHYSIVEWQSNLADQIEQWWNGIAVPMLLSGNPIKHIVYTLSESILDAFIGIPLLDCYTLYQAFIDYWNSALSSAIEIIQADGWSTAIQLIPSSTGSMTLAKEKYESQLVSKLTLYEYFGAQSILDAALTNANQASAELETALEDYKELLEDACIERDEELVLNKASISAYLKTIKGMPMMYQQEINAINHLLSLYDTEAKANKGKKAAEDEATQMLINAVVGLSEQECVNLVIDYEWKQGIMTMFNRVVQEPVKNLIQELKAIYDQYGVSLEQLEYNMQEARRKFNDLVAELGY